MPVSSLLTLRVEPRGIIGEDIVNIVSEAAFETARFLREQGVSFSPDTPRTIYIYDNFEGLIKDLLEFGALKRKPNETDAEAVERCLREFGWVGGWAVKDTAFLRLTNSTSTEELRERAAHEMVHVIQLEAAGQANWDFLRHRWLSEGSATLISRMVVHGAGYLSRRDIIAFLREQGIRKIVDLSDIATESGFFGAVKKYGSGTVYDTSTVAVNFLLRGRRSIKPVFEYCSSFQHDPVDAEGNFKAAFGIDAKSFDRSFRAALARLIRQEKRRVSKLRPKFKTGDRVRTREDGDIGVIEKINKKRDIRTGDWRYLVRWLYNKVSYPESELEKIKERQ